MGLTQYEIVLVNLDPTIGSEIKKTRPCLIVSPDEMNKYLRTIIIAPMTTKSKDYPTRIKVEHNFTTSWVAIDQIRTVDKRRVIKKLGKLNTIEILEVKTTLQETFVD